MPEGLKPSYYNFLFDLDDGTHLAFNAMTGAFVRIHDGEFDKVRKLLSNPDDFMIETDSDQRLVDETKRAKFLIESDIDEFKILQFRSNQSKYSTEKLHLTIMPTLECNFRCPYCYESPVKGKMSLEYQEALLQWADKKLKTCRKMSVGWFGGEPLMAPRVVDNLSRKFRDLSLKHDVEYTVSITTNGYYLTPKFIGKMDEMALKLVQVTVDGPPEEHNKRRKLKNGKGTFERIMNNLTHLCEATDDVELIIRVNFDKDSFNKIPELFQYIPDIVRLKSRIYFRQMFPPPKWWDAEEPARESSIDRNPEPLNFMAFQKAAQDMGHEVLLSAYSPQAGYCEADFINNFVIDAECNLHKCTVAFDEEHRVGRILPDGTAEINIPMLSRWMLRDSIEKSICKDCRILPLCMGGCSFTTLCHHGKSVCSTVNSEAMTIDNLKLLYKNLIIAENNRQKRVVAVDQPVS